MRSYSEKVIAALRLALKSDRAIGFLPMQYLRATQPNRPPNSHSKVAVGQTAGFMGKLVTVGLLSRTEDYKFTITPKGEWVYKMHLDGWRYEGDKWVHSVTKKQLSHHISMMCCRIYTKSGEFVVVSPDIMDENDKNV